MPGIYRCDNGTIIGVSAPRLGVKIAFGWPVWAKSCIADRLNTNPGKIKKALFMCSRNRILLKNQYISVQRKTKTGVLCEYNLAETAL